MNAFVERLKLLPGRVRERWQGTFLYVYMQSIRANTKLRNELEIERQRHVTTRIEAANKIDEARKQLSDFRSHMFEYMSNERYYVDWFVLHAENRTLYENTMKLSVLQKDELALARERYEAVESFLIYVRDKYRARAEAFDAERDVLDGNTGGAKAFAEWLVRNRRV